MGENILSSFQMFPNIIISNSIQIWKPYFSSRINRL
jgi:hypothetical protein